MQDPCQLSNSYAISAYLSCNNIALQPSATMLDSGHGYNGIPPMAIPTKGKFHGTVPAYYRQKSGFPLYRMARPKVLSPYCYRKGPG